MDLQVLHVRRRADDAEDVRLLSPAGMQRRRRGRPRGAGDAASRIGRVGFAAGARRSTACEDVPRIVVRCNLEGKMPNKTTQKRTTGKAEAAGGGGANALQQPLR